MAFDLLATTAEGDVRGYLLEQRWEALCSVLAEPLELVATTDRTVALAWYEGFVYRGLTSRYRPPLLGEDPTRRHRRPQHHRHPRRPYAVLLQLPTDSTRSPRSST